MLFLGSTAAPNPKRREGEGIRREVQFKALDPEKTLMRINDEGMRKQLKRCVEYLKQNLTKVEIEWVPQNGYYTCAESHDIRHIEAFCKREKICLPRFLYIMEDWLGRTVSCDCDILNDRKEVTRKRLSAAFRLDFGEEGKRDFDVV